MSLTIESYLAGPIVDRLYDVYAKAFRPLATTAAARHLLDAAEFAAEMADPRIDKYIVWDDEGRPIGMTTFTTDMTAVPWISAQYYTARYPEHAAAGKLYYLGYTLVAPEREQEGVAGRILAKLARRLIDEGAVCGFDVSGHNDDTRHIIARLASSTPATVQPVDVQTYYAADFTACAR
jgi:GNAT superfamily N-acetyltransferase